MGYNPLANTLVAPDCASKYAETPQKRIAPGLLIDALHELVRCAWQTRDLQSSVQWFFHRLKKHGWHPLVILIYLLDEFLVTETKGIEMGGWSQGHLPCWILLRL